MAELNQLDSEKFEDIEYDVTFCCELLACGNTKLHLGPEEAELTKTACFACETKKRGPYGELGTVDSAQSLCFHGFSAGSLLPPGPNGEDRIQLTGCGCERERVENIVEELKRRQAGRGDRAKIRIAETTIQELRNLEIKVDAVMDHLQISYDPKSKVPVTEPSMSRDS